MRTLYIIDAFAQIFRAFYAIRGGMNSPVTGEPTHAVFGMTAMVLKLLTQLDPDFVIVAKDTPGKTFRDDLFADYKGHRPAMPEDLAPQIPRVFELLEGFGFPIIGKDDLEADDVIATVVRNVLDDPALGDIRIRILSKDKDLEQLLCDRVSLFDHTTDVEIDVAALLANKGISPRQVIDYLSLTGDTADNVPGVEGIGPKTASQLLQQYDTLEGIYEHIHEIKGKRRENLEKARGVLPLSRALVTLRYDPSLPLDLAAATVRPPRTELLLPLFRALGFNRFQQEVQRLAGSANSGAPAPPAAPADVTPGTLGLDLGSDAAGTAAADGAGLTSHAQPAAGAERAAYRAIRTAAELEAILPALRSAPMLSVDTETTGLQRDARLCGLSLSWRAGEGVYIPVLSPEPETHLNEAQALAILGPILEDEAVPKCGHNLKFDARMLMNHGVRLRGAQFDSMLAGALLDPSANNKLDLLAEKLLRYRMIPITDLIGSGPEQGSMDRVPLEQLVPYAAEDADIALRLYLAQKPLLEGAEMLSLVRDVEAPLSIVIAEMEQNGILCDPDELIRQGRGLEARVEELRKAIFELAGDPFHLDSPKQLAEVLFERLHFPPGKRTKTGFSTDAEELERLASMEDPTLGFTRIPRLILEYRQLAKLISTYLGNLRAAIQPDTGRIHSTFHQLVTATGRLASNNPNLQNIPIRSEVGRQIRKAFPAAPGHLLICADYSQIELRLLAHLSRDEALVRAFDNDEDIHKAVASRVFAVPLDEVTREQRSHAKTINFGIIYGVTAFGLARRIEGLDRSSAATLIADYKRQFSGIDVFLQECVRQARDLGYVTTILKRRRAIPEIKGRSNAERALGERLAINTVVQGSAADLIKLAMVNVQRRIDREKLPLKLLLQIHDELVFETPIELAEAHAALVREEMERAMDLCIPLRAEAGIGPDWMSAK